VGVRNMDQDEARQIMAEIDAKSSALLAVLAILLAAATFLFSLDRNLLTLGLMFGQVATVSVSILFLLRCLIYEPSPRLRHVFEMEEVEDDFHLQIEAIKQVRYFNRVIVLTMVTSVLVFVMAANGGSRPCSRPRPRARARGCGCSRAGRRVHPDAGFRGSRGRGARPVDPRAGTGCTRRSDIPRRARRDRGRGPGRA
jgi:hypothetical protein